MHKPHFYVSANAPQPTPEWVPDNYEKYGRYWEGCTNQVNVSRVGHPLLPSWYTNKMYDSRIEQTWWQHYVRVSGLQNAIATRRAHLAGYQGVRGTWWCGACFFNMILMQRGEALDYPNAYDFYKTPITRDAIGYAAWLYIARYGGSVVVQTMVRAVEASLHTTEQVTRGVLNTFPIENAAVPVNVLGSTPGPRVCPNEEREMLHG